MSLVSPVPLIEALGDTARDFGAYGQAPEQGLLNDLALNGVNYTAGAPVMSQPSVDTGLTSLVMGNKPTSFKR